MRETVLLKDLRVPDKNILLDANPDIGASIHIHGNVKIDANLDSSADTTNIPQFPPDDDTCPYMHKESILTCIEDEDSNFKVIKEEDATIVDGIPAHYYREHQKTEVGIRLESGTAEKGYILLEEATNGD